MSILPKFCDLAKGQVNKGIYVWGAQGELLSSITPEWIKKKETSTENYKKALAMYDKRKGIKGAKAFDCSGLVCWALVECGAKPKGFDSTADGLMKNQCDSINKSQLRDGDLCFKVKDGKANHVGVYVGGKIIEAKGRAYGVVSSSVSSAWTAFGRLNIFKTAEPTYYFILSRTLYWMTKKLGKKATNMKGDDVRAVQTRLINLGYYCGKTGADGELGQNTYIAIRNFQAEHKDASGNKLTVDGIVGKKTCEALGGKWQG